MKLQFTLLSLLFFIHFYAQKTDLNNINTVIEAENFIEQNNTVFAQIETITTTADSLNFYRKKLEKRALKENIKVLESKKIVAMKVNYIFFDGSKLTKQKIDLKRKEILDLYKKGATSDDLVAQHTMDRNVKKGGNFGWIDEIDVEKTFSEAVKAHEKGDVFLVDVPSFKWYYIVFKLFNDREKVALYYLKVH